MGVLEQVNEMKNQRMPDREIVDKLTEQGISPKEINDALSQAQIKSAVSDTEDLNDMPPKVEERTPGYPRTQETEPYAPPTPQANQTYTPQTQELSEPKTYAPPAQEAYYPQEEYAPQESYDYVPGETTSTDTLIEISEQVFSEKIKKIQKQVDDLNEFKILAQTKIDHISERLKRIETTIDKLQSAILEKIGSYGRNLDSIKKEMSMMQDSFGKVVNQAVHKTEKKSPTKTKKKKTSKRK